LIEKAIIIETTRPTILVASRRVWFGDMAENNPQSNELTDHDELNGADDVNENKVIYANDARVRISLDDVTIDLFQHEPNGAETKTAKPVARIVLPADITMALAERLLNGLGHAEEKAWDDLEKLFAVWDARGDAEDDIDDEWLTSIRTGWNNRLKELYDTDAGE
jgi:hypothetical protein